MPNRSNSKNKSNNTEASEDIRRRKRKDATPEQTTLKQQAESSLKQELWGALFVAIGILMLVCLFVPDAALPLLVSKVLFGVFGLLAYAVPLCVAALGICKIIVKRIQPHAGKTVSGIVFALGIAGLVHCITTDVWRVDADYLTVLKNTYSLTEQAMPPMGAGALASLYIVPLYKLLGTVALYVLLVCAIGISVILLFNFSYRRAGKKVHDRITDIKKQKEESRSTASRSRYKTGQTDDDFDIDEFNKRQAERREKKKRESMYDNLVDDYEGADDVTDYTMPEYHIPAHSVKDFTGEDAEEAIREENTDQQQILPETDADEKETGTNESVNTEFSSFDVPDEKTRYVFPPLSLLTVPKQQKARPVNYNESIAKLERVLSNFGINSKVINYTVGPAITRYELTVEEGIRINRILTLTDEIEYAMAVSGVRMEAPIPGKSAVGIEIPNREVEKVYLRDVIESDNFKNHPSCVAIGLGKDITGKSIVADIGKMPHLLIAGQTGSGKSVAINSLILSILYKSTPEQVKLILIDPKQVELSVYNGLPHLLLPVVSDPKKAAGALQYVVRQMEKRYRLFTQKRVKDIKKYNEAALRDGEPIMPRIVLIVDELNDLMMVCSGEVEDSVLRISQLARAAGIHLVLATQRPSVNVITGVIKANIPSRMAFAVASVHDSKTILDRSGAEHLVGRGDMLYHHNGEGKPLRIQGAYVEEDDIEKIVQFITDNCSEPDYIDESEIVMVQQNDEAGSDPDEGEYDELIFKAIEAVMNNEEASVSLLQRKLGIGHPRAGRLMDIMETMHIVGPHNGSKPREILITYEDYMNRYKRK